MLPTITDYELIIFLGVQRKLLVMDISGDRLEKKDDMSGELCFQVGKVGTKKNSKAIILEKNNIQGDPKVVTHCLDANISAINEPI